MDDKGRYDIGDTECLNGNKCIKDKYQRQHESTVDTVGATENGIVRTSGSPVSDG